LVTRTSQEGEQQRVSNSQLEFAVEQGVENLRVQDSTLAKLRDRAAGVLLAASLIISIIGGFGVTKKDVVFLPTWTAILLLAILVLIGALVMSVQWPVHGWSFGLHPKLILERINEDIDDGVLYRYLINELVEAMAANDKTIVIRGRLYRIAAALLIAEVVAFALALAFHLGGSK
jgi:hypothetical protein